MEVRLGEEERWILTMVYANPHSVVRNLLWDKMEVLKTQQPWLLNGDFNCVLEDYE